MSAATPATRPSDMLHMAERMTGDFPLVVMSLEQESIPAHGHDFVELVFVNRGAGQHRHAGRSYPIFAGDCFVVLPGESHGYDDPRDLRITNILFFPAILRHHASDLAQAGGFTRFFALEPLFRSEDSFRHKLHLGASQQKVMAQLCAGLERELGQRRAGYRSLCTGLLLQLVVEVGRWFDSATSSASVREQFQGKQSMVEAAIAYLEQHYGSDVRVEDVARSAYISPSRLAHVFRDATGMSLMDYLAQVRIDRAQQLLAEGGRSVAEIAYSLGFESPAYFTRLFRRMTGQAPTAFRRSGPAAGAAP